MAQSCPASHVEDHLPAADRECLDDCLAVALKGASPTIVGAGMLPVGRLRRQLWCRRRYRRRGITRFADDPSPLFPMERPFLAYYCRYIYLPAIYQALRPGKYDNRQ